MSIEPFTVGFFLSTFVFNLSFDVIAIHLLLLHEMQQSKHAQTPYEMMIESSNSGPEEIVCKSGGWFRCNLCPSLQLTQPGVLPRHSLPILCIHDGRRPQLVRDRGDSIQRSGKSVNFWGS